jgi:hypothetical protein
MKMYHHVLAFDRNEAAKLRLEILTFFDKYGLQASVSAFKVSKATIYRWRRKYLDEQKKLISLVPQSTIPKRVRRRLVDPKILSYIKKLRLTYGVLGKDKLKPLVDEYCQKSGMASVCLSLYYPDRPDRQRLGVLR